MSNLGTAGGVNVVILVIVMVLVTGAKQGSATIDPCLFVNANLLACTTASPRANDICCAGLRVLRSFLLPATATCQCVRDFYSRNRADMSIFYRAQESCGSNIGLTPDICPACSTDL